MHTSLWRDLGALRTTKFVRRTVTSRQMVSTSHGHKLNLAISDTQRLLVAI